MKDDLNPYRWQDHVITPQLSAANLVVSALIIFVIGGAAVFAGPDPTGTAFPSSGAPVAQAIERDPCLALIARPSMLLHRAGRHML